MNEVVWSLIIPLTTTVVACAAITVFVLRAPALRRAWPSISVPAVSVVIPARNEADKLGLLLADIAAQSARVDPSGITDAGRVVGVGSEPRPVVEVVVVDDESTDGTAEVARAGGAVVIDSRPRPAGWNPTVWALWLGSAHTHHDELVFLDADVRLGPGALRAVVAARQREGGLASVAPHHRAVGLREALSAAANVVAVAGGGPGMRTRAAGAVGSCVAMHTADYTAIGGHGAHPATIVDDLTLAATARSHDLPVTLYRGGDLVAMRSSPDGLRAVVDGWSKNLAAGMGHTRPSAAVVVALWITSLLLPVALAAQQRWVPAGVLWALSAAHTGWLSRRVGRFHPLVTTLGAPVLGLFTTYLTIRSVLAVATRRSVTWKGRALGADGLETEAPIEDPSATGPREGCR
ncbi:MAG: glycosyltransferase [Acidimicrobiales bacterium]